jgi:hypothetical protein
MYEDKMSDPEFVSWWLNYVANRPDVYLQHPTVRARFEEVWKASREGVKVHLYKLTRIREMVQDWQKEDSAGHYNILREIEEVLGADDEHAITRDGCPCVAPDAVPCGYACSCAHMFMSGGCLCCAKYGSVEQRTAAGKHIRKVLREDQEALPDAWPKIIKQVRELHQYMKRGPDTEDHGLSGNLRCIFDAVISRSLYLDKLELAFGHFAFSTGEVEGVWFVEEGSRTEEIAKKCEDKWNKWKAEGHETLPEY